MCKCMNELNWWRVSARVYGGLMIVHCAKMRYTSAVL